MSDQDATHQIVKETPPEPSRGGGGRTSQLVTELEPLIDDPGEWYRIRTGLAERYARTQASRINKLGTEDGRFHAVARKQADGTAGIWCQYVTNGSEPAEAPARSRRRNRAEQVDEAVVA